MFERLREKLTGIAKEDEEEIVFKKLEEDDFNLKNGVDKEEEESILPKPKRAEDNSNIELKVVRPESIAEISTVADHLLSGCTVVLNLELLDNNVITRMLDFLRGVAYTIDGEIKHVSKATYIITANGIDISDSI